MKHYVFLDLETTGLEPLTDKILEVAWIITDNKLENPTTLQSYVVRPNVAIYDRLKNLPPVVDGMHTDSGLLDAVVGPNTYPLARIDEWLAGDITRRNTEGDTWHLAGNSVHFDRKFIDRYMPLTSHLLHHRILDTSSIKLLLDATGVNVMFDYENINPHRAGEDTLEAYTYSKTVQRFLHGGSYPLNTILDPHIMKNKIL